MHSRKHDPVKMFSHQIALGQCLKDLLFCVCSLCEVLTASFAKFQSLLSLGFIEENGFLVSRCRI